MTSDLRALRYEQRDAVALVTLSRPDRLNAWTARMASEYRWALEHANADPSVGVIVVTGDGRGFCAGADVKALSVLAAGDDYRADDGTLLGVVAEHPTAPDFDHAFSWPLALDKPVIAAINGPVAGVGFVLACFCDIRFASDSAVFTTSFARLGLPAEHGVSWILSRLVGAGRAADLLLSSRRVDAAEALAIGLVSRVVPDASLVNEAVEYAQRMATELAPTSLATIKRQLWSDANQSLDHAATAAEALLPEMLASPEFAEGAAALAEKRPPRFHRGA
ncbi:MAG TPA: enoyl-CoA hydratase-related protein [Acidimicrobiales bacterium]|nr:enoyl-CoA hydratase-related protein [Acidimicrobiales bacterium]